MANFSTKKVSQKQKNANYINDINLHQEVKVKTDPRKENHSNSVKVKSQITKEKPMEPRLDDIGNAHR